MDDPQQGVTSTPATAVQGTPTYPPYQKATVSPIDLAHLRLFPPDAVVGMVYTVDIYTQCGLEHTRFGEANWRSEENPLPRDGMPYWLSGTMELLDPDTVRFVIDLRYFSPPVEVIIYHRTSEEPPGLCG